MTISAAIFDLDGTLVDSADHYFATFRTLMTELGVNGFDRREYNASTGRSTRDMLAGLRVNYSIDVSLDELVARIAELYLADLAGHVKIFPQMCRLLELVHDAGMATAVASGSPARILEEVLDTFDLHKHVDHWVTAEHAGAGKPDPHIFLCAARALNTPPRSCIAIEDSGPGIIAAARAGIRCIAVPPPGQEKHDQTFTSAALVLPGGSAFCAHDALQWINQDRLEKI